MADIDRLLETSTWISSMPKRPFADSKFKDLVQPVDPKEIANSIRETFSLFPDPRCATRCEYPAWVMILIMICALLARCETVSDMAAWAHAAEKPFLKPLLGEEFQAPSYDTIWWFLVRVCPKAFNTLLKGWWERLPPEMQSKIFAIDGKRITGAGKGKDRVLLVELYATELGLTIAQEAVPSKNSEPIAVPELLKSIDVSGAIVSLDAIYASLGGVKNILGLKTSLKLEAGVDYVVALKGNQPTLLAHVADYFEQALAAGPDWEPLDVHDSNNQGPKIQKHGRDERRVVSISHNVGWLNDHGYKDWEIATLIKVQSERTVKGQTEVNVRYYISSRRESALFFSQIIRGHWGIESGLHYVLDVVFREDDCQANTGHSAENLGCLRRYARNLIKILDPTRSFAEARRAACWHPDYLLGLLSRAFAIK